MHLSLHKSFPIVSLLYTSSTLYIVLLRPGVYIHTGSIELYDYRGKLSTTRENGKYSNQLYTRQPQNYLNLTI